MRVVTLHCLYLKRVASKANRRTPGRQQPPWIHRIQTESQQGHRGGPEATRTALRVDGDTRRVPQGLPRAW